MRNLSRPITLVLLVTGIVLTAKAAAHDAAAIPLSAPMGLVAEGHDSRIDLVWDRLSQDDLQYWNVYRADSAEGPWHKLNELPHTIHVYSDFVGENGKTYRYRVTRVERTDGRTSTKKGEPLRGWWWSGINESDPSEIVEATTVAMDEEQWLDSVQMAFFRYFWDFGHPVSGLAREGFFHPRHVVTTGGTGFGMMTIMVGAERGFVTREQAAERLLQMVTFLEEKASRYHGIWSHHLRGDTGETLPFAGETDNGGDIVESAFLLEGMLCVREYFDQDNPTENELRERITRLWEEAEWDWYQQPCDKALTWHWSKEHGFVRDHKIGGFNECMIAYLLAMASPTQAIPADSYYLGWVGDPKNYVNGKTYYDIVQPVGSPMGGPLFFTHYSFMGLDPHALNDRYTNYFKNNRAISLINRAYCAANPREHYGYSDLVWGLTASMNPDGYGAHQPDSDADNGTISPTAAISAMPYTPEESLATLRDFYHGKGKQLWGAFGFYDAFNEDADWVTHTFLAIDQGPMAPMIENHRTGLPWKMFMKSDVAAAIVAKLDEATANYDATMRLAASRAEADDPSCRAWRQDNSHCVRESGGRSAPDRRLRGRNRHR
jgi:exo beta-1,2-glucooligosaccharide sophorohydrolase (non-reducing end)